MTALPTRVAIAADGVGMSALKDNSATLSTPSDDVVQANEEESAALIYREVSELKRAAINSVSPLERARYIIKGTHTHISQEKNTDSEVYSTRACLKARSCKIALVASIIVLLLVLAALILLLGEWTGS